MKMGAMTTVTMGLTSLLLSVLLLAEPSQEQVAWRPQGRFGKRNYLEQRLPDEILSNTLRAIHEQQLVRAKGMKLLSVPHFESDGLFCLASDGDYEKGLYRCVTFVDDADADVTQH